MILNVNKTKIEINLLTPIVFKMRYKLIPKVAYVVYILANSPCMHWEMHIIYAGLSLTEEGTMRSELLNNVLTEAYYKTLYPTGLLC